MRKTDEASLSKSSVMEVNRTNDKGYVFESSGVEKKQDGYFQEAIEEFNLATVWYEKGKKYAMTIGYPDGVKFAQEGIERCKNWVEKCILAQKPPEKKRFSLFRRKKKENKQDAESQD